MSRYTDYDALMNRLGICVKTGMGSTIAFTFKHIVDETPSIDIVRCGECEKRKKNKFCLEHKRYEKNDDDFCSYGERREEDDQ